MQHGHLLDGKPWVRGTTLLAGLAAAAVLAPQATATPATAHSGRLSDTTVKEEGRLHLAHKGSSSAIIEEGSASGTFSASLSAQITIKISKVTGSIVVSLRGGSISGNATATPHFSGKYVSFKGSFTVNHGTGRYAGASGTAGFYGVLNHATYDLTVQLLGQLRM